MVVSVVEVEAAVSKSDTESGEVVTSLSSSATRAQEECGSLGTAPSRRRADLIAWTCVHGARGMEQGARSMEQCPVAGLAKAFFLCVCTLTRMDSEQMGRVRERDL